MYQYFVPAGANLASAAYAEADFTSDLPTSVPVSVPALPPQQQPVAQPGPTFRPRTSMSVLNEKFPHVQKSFVFEDLEKPTKFNNNTALFRCSAQVEGVTYSALGSSKKSAKQNLAEQLLPSLLGQRGSSGTNASKLGKRAWVGSNTTIDSTNVGGEDKVGRKRRKLLEKLNRENFVQVFMEMCNLMGDAFKPTFEYTQQPPKSDNEKPHEALFDCKLQVGDKTFVTSGPGKKFIKQEAIKRAFKAMFDIDLGKDFMADDKREMFNQLAINGRKNLRQILQVYAGRRNLQFKVECEEIKEEAKELKEEANEVKAEGKEAVDGKVAPQGQKPHVKQHRGTCQLGDLICSNVSSLSRKDCLDQLFVEVLAKHFNEDVASVRSQMERRALPPVGLAGGVLPVVKASVAKMPVQLVYELCGKNNFTVTFGDGELVAGSPPPPPPPPHLAPTNVDRSTTPAHNGARTNATANPSEKCFVVKASINDSTFVGYGKSKKAAKHDAAVKLLKEVFALDYANDTVCSATDDFSKEMSAGGRRRLTKLQKYLAACQSDGDKILAAKVAFFAREKYSDVLRDFNVIPSTTFSAFLISDSQATEGSGEEFKVVSLASGNRSCSTRLGRGASLHDCHGAVLARRGLLLYFYDQLALLSDMARRQESIFEEVPESETQGRQGVVWSPYRLKKRYALHMYDSRLPPGDASADQYDTNYRNCLRCYQPDGVATVPIMYLTKQMSRQPYVEMGASFNPDFRSMSLSDKMLKWNILGIQGALLSTYIDPIYLESLVIGQNFCKSTVKKAIFSRFDLSMWFPAAKLVGSTTVSADVAKAYDPHCPKLYAFEYDPFSVTQQQRQQWANKYSAATDESGDSLQAPTDYALSWLVTAPIVEFLVQESGLELYRRPSRLTKQNFLDKYSKLRSSLVVAGLRRFDMIYSEAKKVAAGYALAKNRFVNLLKSHGLGNWLEKSITVDNFSVPWLTD